jgi:predicted dehydrogenase
MNSDTVHIGVIGVGHLGRWHVQQLKLIPEAKLCGIYDSDKKRSAEIEKEFNTKAYPNFKSLLNDIEALSIVTPTITHYNYALQALESGKHIFIEKPITETIEQGEKLIALADKENLKIQVGHIERFNPAILALAEFKLNPLFVESHRMSNFNPRGTDVAVVLDLMIHDIDLILSFIDSPVKSIDASGVSIVSQKEDIANCRLNFENGAVANVTASRISTRKMRKMRFFQPNAYISVDFLEGHSEVYELIDSDSGESKQKFSFSFGKVGQGKNAKEISYKRFDKKDINPLNHELKLFLLSIMKDETPAVTGQQGLRALKVAKDILQNIEEHSKLVKTKWGI